MGQQPNGAEIVYPHLSVWCFLDIRLHSTWHWSLTGIGCLLPERYHYPFVCYFCFNCLKQFVDHSITIPEVFWWHGSGDVHDMPWRTACAGEDEDRDSHIPWSVTHPAFWEGFLI